MFLRPDVGRRRSAPPTLGDPRCRSSLATAVVVLLRPLSRARWSTHDEGRLAESPMLAVARPAMRDGRTGPAAGRSVGAARRPRRRRRRASSRDGPRADTRRPSTVPQPDRDPGSPTESDRPTATRGERTRRWRSSTPCRSAWTAPTSSRTRRPRRGSAPCWPRRPTGSRPRPTSTRPARATRPTSVFLSYEAMFSCLRALVYDKGYREAGLRCLMLACEELYVRPGAARRRRTSTPSSAPRG